MFEFLTRSLDFIFGPLLMLPTIWAVILVSFVLSLITVLIYKWTTNQQLMKELKDEIKALQTEAKQLKDKPQEAMDVQKKAMETNMKYMSHSMRPTLITFLPIILIFGWMNANFAFEQIMPGQEFSISVAFQQSINGSIAIQTSPEITLTGKLQTEQDSAGHRKGATREITNGETIFTMNAKEGRYNIKFLTNGQEYNKEVLVTQEQKYLEPITTINDKIIKTITTSNKQKIVLNLFNWKLGWLGTYIICSIIFSIILRKWMKVY